MKYLKVWWLPAVLLIVGIAGGVWYMNHLRNRASTAEADRDRAKIEAAGGSAAHLATEKQLREEAGRLASANAGLEAEITRIKAAMPGSRPVGTLSGGTAPGGVVVGPAAGIPVATPQATSGSAPSSAPTCPACALLVGDRVELKVAGVALVGDSGAIGVAATAQAWRVGEPAVLLAEGPLRLEVKMKDPGQLPGWGAGAVIVGGRSGWWFGPLVSPPPIRVWGLEASLLLGVGVGGGGEWGGLAGGLLRW